MGNPRNALVGLDPSNEVQKEQIEAIEALADLARSKADTMTLEILRDIDEAGSEFNKSIPVESFLDKRIETHAYNSESADAVVQQLTGSLKDFIEGGAENIVNGIGQLLGTAVQAFLGSGEASEDLFERYMIYTNGLGLERFDLKVWKRKIKVSGLQDKMQCVSAFVGIRSAVDLNKIKLNTFLILYSKQLEKMGLNDTEIDKAIDEAKNIYSKLHSNI
ncbi:hypothetical protein PGN35_028190 [Nodosilinea sp. PGN35]|uniref:hypothetical protein n=1 Tax=Nodosilinea sp. PGN35 TaxID=3020489 RepID=UPI0023B2FBF8|nr:hypothetical protein [Nodosilinea sp. TSF1-S3]MDF0365319.1 hypothetical protein [Nodosilinea sp. TSF1-S3]